MNIFKPSDLQISTETAHQHKKYQKRYSKNDYRGTIPNRVDIDEHFDVVNTHARISPKLHKLAYQRTLKNNISLNALVGKSLEKYIRN